MATSNGKKGKDKEKAKTAKSAKESPQAKDQVWLDSPTPPSAYTKEQEQSLSSLTSYLNGTPLQYANSLTAQNAANWMPYGQKMPNMQQVIYEGIPHNKTYSTQLIYLL